MVTSSRIIYASSVWADRGTKTAKNRGIIQRAQRTVILRTIWAYRTVSTIASLILASTLPADFLARIFLTG